MDKIITTINKILKENYPVKTTFDEINNLSHFEIFSHDWKKFLTININIDGKILTGPYKNYQIVQVITTETMDWTKYLLLYASFIPKMKNPCINETKFIYLVHTFNYIDIFNIKKLLIKNVNTNTNSVIEYQVEYTNKINYQLPWDNHVYKHIIKQDNHFYLESFDVYNNYKKLKIEIDRLIKNRDKYKTIHFHLDNNGGGDIVPAHMILRCLVGKKEKWMRNIKKILKNKKTFEWNCWEEESNQSPNYLTVKKLNLDNLPNYDTKYSGKIYLHMNKQNGSAAWFFITYLIYAFSDKINRYYKKCYGQTIKYGTIQSDNLILLGHSGTTSGDGNAIPIKNNSIIINCPTEQFISSSIKKSDWNRFWISQ